MIIFKDISLLSTGYGGLHDTGAVINRNSVMSLSSQLLAFGSVSFVSLVTTSNPGALEMMKHRLSILIEDFLWKKLNEGHHELVYGLSAYWGTKSVGFWGFCYGAAWSVQDRLIKDFGYHRCPSCHWSTTDKVHSGWCVEQLMQKIEED